MCVCLSVYICVCRRVCVSLYTFQCVSVCGGVSIALGRFSWFSARFSQCYVWGFSFCFCFFFCFCFIFILVALYLCFFFFGCCCIYFALLYYFSFLFCLLLRFVCGFCHCILFLWLCLTFFFIFLYGFFMPTSFSSHAASVPSYLIHSTVLRVSCLHSSPLFLPLAVLEASLSHLFLLWLLLMLFPRASLSRPLTQSGRILSYPSDHDECCEPRLCTQCWLIRRLWEGERKIKKI